VSDIPVTERRGQPTGVLARRALEVARCDGHRPDLGRGRAPERLAQMCEVAIGVAG
jgi:hypothetical protein